MKARLTLNDKKLEFPLKKCSGWEVYKGLMFSKKPVPLLLEIPNKSIHSYFVKYPFLALWLNEYNKIVDYRMIQPGTASLRPESDFTKLIEIPYSPEYKTLVDNILGTQKDLNTEAA